MRNARLAALLVLASACVSSGTYEKKVQEADQLRWALHVERQKTGELEGKIEDANGQVATARGETDRIADRLSQVNASLAQREIALKQAAAKEGQLQATVADLSKSKDELQVRYAELEQKSAEYEQLQQSLKSEIEQGQIELAEAKGRMTVKLKDKILFASGSAKIGPEGKQALAKVADAFKELKGKVVRVEGHTDDRPIGGAAFPSNWELSGARALAVVRYLQERGVDPAILAGAAYSQYRPVTTNDTPEGRSLNRRIEIVLAPAES